MKNKLFLCGIFVCVQFLLLSCSKDSAIKNEVKKADLPEVYKEKSQEYNVLLVSLLDKIEKDDTPIETEEALLEQGKKYINEFKSEQQKSAPRKVAPAQTEQVDLTYDQLNIIGKINKVSLTSNIADPNILNEILSEIEALPENQRDLPYVYLAVATSSSENEIKAMLGENPEFRLGNWQTFVCNLSCALIGGIHGAAIGACIGGLPGTFVGTVWGAVEGSMWSTIACTEPATPLQPNQYSIYNSTEPSEVDDFLNNYEVYVAQTEDGSIDLNADINWVYPVIEDVPVVANTTQERDAYIRLQNTVIKSRTIAPAIL